MNILTKIWAVITLGNSKNPKLTFLKMVLAYLTGIVIAVIALVYYPMIAVLLIIVVLVIEYIGKKIFGRWW